MADYWTQVLEQPPTIQCIALGHKWISTPWRKDHVDGTAVWVQMKECKRCRTMEKAFTSAPQPPREG